MAIDDQTKSALAEELYEAAMTVEPIEQLTARHDLTIEDAYEIQSRLMSRRMEDGGSLVGHKVGLTSQGIRDQFDVDEPDFGRLLDSMFVEGQTIPMDQLIGPRIEPEIGFVLAETLDPPVTYLDVLEATSGVLPVLEVIDSRIRDWEIEIQDTIADNASSALFLTGGQRRSIDDVDLSLEGVKLYHNGTLQAAGVGAAVLEHPARAVAWLANTLSDLDETLEAGHIVISGSLTPSIDIEPGDVITVEFTTIGSRTVRAGDVE